MSKLDTPSLDNPAITESLLYSSDTKSRRAPQRLTLLLLLSVTLVTLGSFQYGYNLSTTNTPQVAIGNRGGQEACESRSFYKPCVPMNTDQYTMFASIFLLGAFSSSLIAGFVSESIGRKSTLVISNLTIISGSIILSLLSNFYFFLLGRYLIGVGVGFASVVVPAYLSEISPSAYRGCIGFMHQLVLVIAIASANLLAIPLSFRPGWRILMAVPGIIGIMQLMFIPFIHDTPRWLVSKGWKNLAKESLQSYRGTPDVEEEFQTLNKPKDEKPFFQAIKSIFRPTLLKPFIMGAFLHMCQQFSGVNVVIFYSTKIFNDAGFHNSGIASAVTGLDFVISTLIGLFVVERLGRKTLFISSLIICALSYTGLAATRILAANGIAAHEMSYVSLVFVLIYIFGYSIGLGPVPWLMLSEIFPPDVKGFFYGIVTAINWICKIAVTFSFPYLNKALHAYTFLPYAIYLYIAVVVAFFLVVETKGKTLEELTGDL